MTDGQQCCGAKWCVRDACGITCVVITWLLMSYGQFVVTAVMILPETDYSVHQVCIISMLMHHVSMQTVNAVVFQLLMVLAALSHVRTMLTDPGTVPKGNATEDRIQRMGFQPGQVVYKCAKCASIKPERAHHCSTCRRCIRKMDHHCPWVNNCVGEANQKFFVLFTMYIMLVSIHSLYWGVWQFVTCIDNNWHKCSSFSPPATTILLVFLLFEALLFSIFTAVMFGTQVHAILTDETGIEQLKGEKCGEETGDRWKALQMVMGGRFGVDWFNPLVAPYVAKRTYQITV